MAKGKRVTAESRRATAAYCSVFEGGVRVDNIAFGQDNPQQRIEEAFKKSRYWFRYNQFIRRIILLRVAFFNFGFGLEADKSEAGAVKEWWKLNRRRAREYARDAWIDWLLLDNIVAIWRTNGMTKPRPLVFPPEDCDYSDLFGGERLEILHRLNAETLKKIPGLSKDEVGTLTRQGGKLTLTHEDERIFAFNVVKRERVGQGLAWPGTAVMFQACSQNEGMEVGDALEGNALRTLIEQHLVGHEIKSGPHAGAKAHFCNEKKAKNVETQFKGKIGHLQVVTNFDHLIRFVRPDSKDFDAKRYDGVYRRAEAWAMPLWQMIYARGLNPYLLEILKTEAKTERENLEEHFNLVMKEALGAPRSARVTWSNRCFKDARTALELLKFGLSGGPVSQETFLEEAGYSKDIERERKAEEAKLPKEVTMPIYDPSHGPGDKTAKKTPGRKPGTADGEGQS